MTMEKLFIKNKNRPKYTHPLSVSDILYDTAGYEIVTIENKKHGIVLYGCKNKVGIGYWTEIVDNGNDIEVSDYEIELRKRNFYHWHKKNLLIKYDTLEIFILPYHKYCYENMIERKNGLTVIKDTDRVSYFNDDGKLIYQRKYKYFKKE